MRVNVLPFGILKEWFGSDAATVELPQGATVADLLERLGGSAGRADRLRGIAVGVNAAYAAASHVLQDGDEVALLPPVSGGTSRPAGVPAGNPGADTIRLTREWIDSAKFVELAKAAEDGAVVVFDGIVRNNSRGRRTLYLEYEAYEEMALKQMRALAAQARERFAIRHVTIVHRLGRIEIGETSVLVIVSAAHRAAAFDANRWLIDTLKQTVPIWKKEFFADGAMWAPGEPFPEPLAVHPAEVAKNG